MLTRGDMRDYSKLRKKNMGVVEKDYAIEWLLSGIYGGRSGIADTMIFKGGTSLGKAVFPGEWRYSVDLDFTLPPGTDPDDVIEGIGRACTMLLGECGMQYAPHMAAQPSGMAIMGYVSFVGPLKTKNRIKVDVSRREVMVRPPVLRTVPSSYSDLADFEVTSYSLEEIVAEKIRSMIQRTKARDYYDAWKILCARDHGLDLGAMAGMVRRKCATAGAAYEPGAIFDPGRLGDVADYWERALLHLATEPLPEPRRVFDGLRRALEFLPPE